MTPIPLTYVARTLGSTLRGTTQSLSAWAPRERVYWALIAEDGNAALYRIGDATEVVTTGRAALGLPPGLVLALWAGADGEIRALVGPQGRRAGVHRLVDGRFVAESIPPFPAAVTDAFAADPAGTLFHVSAATGRIGALTADAYTEIGGLDMAACGLPIKGVQAVWDAAGADLVVVVLGADGPFTQRFKDGAVRASAGVPGVGRSDPFFRGVALVREPRSGRALLLRRPGDGSWAGTAPLAVHVLEDMGWRVHACDPTPVAEGFTNGDGEVLALAVGRVPYAVDRRYISNTAVRREFARFDGERWRLCGRVVPICQALVVGPGGPVALLGGETLADLVDGALSSRPSGPELSSRPSGPELVPRPAIEDLRAVVATPSGVVAIGPKDAPQLAPQAAYVWHPTLGVLAIGGKGADGKETQATMVLRDGAWVELKTRAKSPRQYGGLAVHDAARGVVVLAGGYSDKNGFVARTAEFDGKAWKTFDAELPWSSVPHAKLLAFDPTSARVFALVAPETGSEHRDLRLGLDVFRYDGAGVWVKASELRFEAPGSHGWLLWMIGFAAAYDPRRRVVVCVGTVDDGGGTGGVLEADVGAMIDAWPALAGVKPTA